MSFFGRLKRFAANRPLGRRSRQFDAATRSLDENFSALLQAHDNQSKMLHEKLSALVQALDNQSELLNRKLDDVRFNSATALELQQAELVMQRDVTDAMHELMRAIKGAKSVQAPANQAREDARTPST